MVVPLIWRCPACNHRYYQLSGGERSGKLYLHCERCGYNYSNTDIYRWPWRIVVVSLLALGGSLLDSYVVQKHLQGLGVMYYTLQVGLFVPVLILGYILVLRKLQWCPDALADPQAAKHEREKRRSPWSQIVPVKSLEEEYRFIQFYPFPCVCSVPTQRKVESHLVNLIAPLWVGRLLGIRLLPIFRLYDTVEVSCLACGGRHTYQFNIASLPHIQVGFRRRFIQEPQSLLETHMTLIIDLQEHCKQTRAYDLQF